MLSSYRSDTFSASDSLSEFDASSETSDNVVASLQEHKQIEGLAILIVTNADPGKAVPQPMLKGISAGHWTRSTVWRRYRPVASADAYSEHSTATLGPFVAVMGAIEQEDQEDDEWLYQLDTAVADSPFTPVNRLFTQLIDGKAETVMPQVANLPAIPPDVIGMPGAAIGTQRLKAMHVQFMHHKYAFVNGPSQSQTQSGVALAGRGRGSVTFAMSQSSSEGVAGAALPIPDQHQQHQSSSSANSSHGSSGGPASGRKLSGGEHVSESTFTSSDAFPGHTLPPSPAAGAGAGVNLNRPTEAGFTLPGVTEQAAEEQSGGEQGRTPSTTARQSDPSTAAASSEEPAPPPGQSGPTARGKPPLIPTTSPRHQTGSGQGQGSGHPHTGAVEQSVPGHATAAVSPGQAALSPRDMGRRFSAATVTSTAEDSPAVSPEHSSAQPPSTASTTSPGLGPAGAGGDVVEWYAGQRMEQVVLAIAKRQQ